MFQVQMRHARVCSMRGMVITVVGEGCVCTCITSLYLCCGGNVPSSLILYIHSLSNG